MTAPPPQQPTDNSSVGGLVVGGALGVVGLATVLIASWEGKSNDPYRDIVGVMTVCYGETHAQMRRYSDAECKTMLQNSVEGDYAPKVFRCVPALRQRPYEGAASISLAYNIGTNAFCRSTVARRFNAGDWRGGCDAFLSWNKARKNGQLVTIRGLTNRRLDERKMCMKGTS